MGSTRFRIPPALSSVLAALGTLQLRAVGILNRVDPLVSASNIICDRHCTSNIAINISIFHLGLIYTRRARIVPGPARRGAERSAPPIVEATALPTGTGAPGRA